MIAIIDYGAGNMKSVENALLFLGQPVQVSADPKVILAADKVILPGVGAFGSAIEKLRKSQLDKVIEAVVLQQKPLLGICLGMQMLFESSEEAPGVAGLNVLQGNVLRFPKRSDYKVPQMGWNALQFPKESRLFAGFAEQSYVYFVHSYYVQARCLEVVSATTDYIVDVHAAVEQNNIYGCQFHPEKSSDVGLKLLRNFINL